MVGRLRQGPPSPRQIVPASVQLALPKRVRFENPRGNARTVASYIFLDLVDTGEGY